MDDMEGKNVKPWKHWRCGCVVRVFDAIMAYIGLNPTCQRIYRYSHTFGHSQLYNALYLHNSYFRVQQLNMVKIIVLILHWSDYDYHWAVNSLSTTDLGILLCGRFLIFISFSIFVYIYYYFLFWYSSPGQFKLTICYFIYPFAKLWPLTTSVCKIMK